MKSLFTLLALCGIASVAHAQLLPVPGAKNPDWKVEKKEALPQASLSDEPIRIDRMPNAMQNSIVSKGDVHHYWDADRQLAYEWRSRPGSGSVAPDKAVLVREDRTGTTYTFRRTR